MNPSDHLALPIYWWQGGSYLGRSTRPALLQIFIKWANTFQINVSSLIISEKELLLLYCRSHGTNNECWCKGERPQEFLICFQLILLGDGTELQSGHQVLQNRSNLSVQIWVKVVKWENVLWAPTSRWKLISIASPWNKSSGTSRSILFMYWRTQASKTLVKIK